MFLCKDIGEHGFYDILIKIACNIAFIAQGCMDRNTTQILFNGKETIEDKTW